MKIDCNLLVEYFNFRFCCSKYFLMKLEMKQLLTVFLVLCCQVMFSSAGKLIPSKTPVRSGPNIDDQRRPMSFIPDLRNDTLLITVKKNIREI